MALDCLYSAFVIDCTDKAPSWRAFDYARSMPMGRGVATPADTNLPRPGYSGLPRGWQARIDRWHSTTSLGFHLEPIIAWAAQTWITLYYHGREWQQLPLVQLMMAPQPIYDTPGGLPASAARGLLMHENVSFGAEIESTSKDADELRAWLITYHNKPSIKCWIWLSGLITSDVAR